MRTLQVTVLDYKELDQLVRTTWPEQKGDFESVAAFEWNNDTDYLWEGVGRPPRFKPETDPTYIAKYEATVREEFEDWLHERGYARQVGSFQVLEGLVRAGKLDPGHYLITVCW